MRAPLAAEFPEISPRIRALLTWYGSGSRDWMNVPFYEQAVLTLLQDYTTQQIVTAMQTGPLSDEQFEGAARAFTSYKAPDRSVPRPPRGTPPEFQYDFAAIPASIKAALLDHVLKSNNNYNILFARSAFSPPPAGN
jgi:hypothetical protein